jgi:hypothetical protein
MYFVPQRTYYSRLSSLVQVLTKSRGHSEFNYSEFPKSLAKAGVHLNVYSEPNAKSSDRIDLHIDVFDKADRTASFVQRQEDEANWLAWAILLPREALVSALSRGMSIEAIAAHFGVSVTLVRFRAQKTGAQGGGGGRGLCGSGGSGDEGE